MKPYLKNSIIIDMLPRDLKILKPSQYSYDVHKAELMLPPQKMPYAVVIKRFQIDYSYEQKYKMGILSMEEYVAWQIQLSQKAQEAQPKQEHIDHTFWERDEKERRNIPENEYEEFLLNNQVDVRNRTTLDMDSIINAHEMPAGGQTGDDDTEGLSEAEAMEQAVAMAVSSSMEDPSDLPGGDDPNRVLSPDEIQALFAAMGAG